MKRCICACLDDGMCAETAPPSERVVAYLDRTGGAFASSDVLRVNTSTGLPEVHFETARLVPITLLARLRRGDYDTCVFAARLVCAEEEEEAATMMAECCVKLDFHSNTRRDEIAALGLLAGRRLDSLVRFWHGRVQVSPHTEMSISVMRRGHFTLGDMLVLDATEPGVGGAVAEIVALARPMLARVAALMEALVKAGLAYMDLKPANVVCWSTDAALQEVRLCDVDSVIADADGDVVCTYPPPEHCRLSENCGFVQSGECTEACAAWLLGLLALRLAIAASATLARLDQWHLLKGVYRILAFENIMRHEDVNSEPFAAMTTEAARMAADVLTLPPIAACLARDPARRPPLRSFCSKHPQHETFPATPLAILRAREEVRDMYSEAELKVDLGDAFARACRQ